MKLMPLNWLASAWSKLMSRKSILYLFMFSFFAIVLGWNAVSAQSDPCSLAAVLASFEAAATSGEVDSWAQQYGASNCPQNIKTAATTFALGYRQATAASTGADDAGIPVNANGVWTLTGILLPGGRHFRVSATGRINPCKPNSSCDKWHLPNGETTAICNDSNCIVSGVPYSALVARIGDGEPFFVGSRGDFTADRDGELQFAVNDTTHHDNRGSFSVTVTVGD